MLATVDGIRDLAERSRGTGATPDCLRVQDHGVETVPAGHLPDRTSTVFPDPRGVSMGWWIALGVAVVVLGYLALSIKVVKEYERGVVFLFGKIRTVRAPGLRFVPAIAERMVRVSLQVTTIDIPARELITSDSVTVQVNAVALVPGGGPGQGPGPGPRLRLRHRRTGQRDPALRAA